MVVLDSALIDVQLYNWIVTDKGDQDCRMLADRHYTRQTIGSPQFTRNGQNIVLTTPDNDAVWVTFRPTPGIAKRMDNLEAWECSIFRNESKFKSSDLIKQAISISLMIWGSMPKDGFITYVQPDKIKNKSLPGYCFLRAGFRSCGLTSTGKMIFKLKRTIVPAIPNFVFYKKGRANKIRLDLLLDGKCIKLYNN